MLWSLRSLGDGPPALRRRRRTPSSRRDGVGGGPHLASACADGVKLTPATRRSPGDGVASITCRSMPSLPSAGIIEGLGGTALLSRPSQVNTSGCVASIDAVSGRSTESPTLPRATSEQPRPTAICVADRQKAAFWKSIPATLGEPNVATKPATIHRGGKKPGAVSLATVRH